MIILQHLVFNLIIGGLVQCCFNHTGFRRLKIEETVSDQINNEETCIFVIDGLHKDSSYEARISYPAVIPTDFVLEAHPLQENVYTGRKLFNVEQLHWTAKNQGYEIKVTAYRTGVPVDLERLNDPVPFNIVVNRLYFGFSLATWKLLASCLLTVVVVLKLLLPRLLKFTDSLVEEMKVE